MGAEDEMTSAPDEEVADTVGSVVIQCEGEGLTVDDDEEEGCAKEEAESVMGEEAFPSYHPVECKVSGFCVASRGCPRQAGRLGCAP